MTNETPCKCCKETGKLFRQKWHSQNKKYYLQTTCKDCERKNTYQWRKDNKEAWASLMQKYYIKVNGPITRNMYHTEESRRLWHLEKATKRATRAKQARVNWSKELTDFIYMEAHSLRKLRNKITSFEWHVDHIIPLKGKNVCGLHIWNNFAVIPKVENLRKGNYYSIHD
jgi:DNA-dependent RNA polymerase auxiliary subunit epsilon